MASGRAASWSSGDPRSASHGAPSRAIRLSAADLAGGSTDPARTICSRPGFLSFDARTLDIEDNGGLAFTCRGRGPRLIIRFGARDERSGHWSTVTRFVGR